MPSLTEMVGSEVSASAQGSLAMVVVSLVDLAVSQSMAWNMPSLARYVTHWLGGGLGTPSSVAASGAAVRSAQPRGKRQMLCMA